jgi:hypothetical protein
MSERASPACQSQLPLPLFIRAGCVKATRSAELLPLIAARTIPIHELREDRREHQRQRRSHESSRASHIVVGKRVVRPDGDDVLRPV